MRRRESHHVGNGCGVLVLKFISLVKHVSFSSVSSSSVVNKMMDEDCLKNEGKKHYRIKLGVHALTLDAFKRQQSSCCSPFRSVQQ